MAPTLSTSSFSSLLIYFFPVTWQEKVIHLYSDFSLYYFFLIIFFGFHVFPLSFPSGSTPPPPFWEFTVTLLPPLRRGAQPLILVPPALLPVRAGLELWGYGDQIHSAPSTPSRDVLGYGRYSLQGSGLLERDGREDREGSQFVGCMCVCARACKHHGKISPDLQDGLVGGEVQSERQGLRPRRLLIPS